MAKKFRILKEKMGTDVSARAEEKAEDLLREFSSFVLRTIHATEGSQSVSEHEVMRDGESGPETAK